MKARNKRYAAILSVVTVLALALSLVAVPVPSFAATVVTSPFSDVTSSTSYSTAIAFLASQGVVGGYPDGTFKPSNTITRAEMAKIIVELAGKDSAAQALSSVTPSFKDASQIPSWAWGYINVAGSSHYINGYPDGTFRANNPVTRAEAFAMMVRLLGDDWVVSGSWPSNYVVAAATVGLTSGLSDLSANVPATRGEIAQLGYNAALKAQYTTTTVVTGGVQTNQLNDGGLFTKNGQIVSGTVSNAGTDSLKIGGTLYGVENKVTIIGASSVPALNNASVTAVVDSNKLVNYIELSSQTTATKTLNNAVAVPSGFSSAGITDKATGYDLVVQDTNGNRYLLFSDGSTVEYTSATTVQVNSGQPVNLATYAADVLHSGDQVTYTLNNGVATSVQVTHFDPTSVQLTAVTTYTSPQKVFAGTYAYNVTSTTTITLNGKSASLSDLQAGDVVDIAHDSSNNAIAINATRQTITGTVIADLGDRVLIQPSGGSVQTVSKAGTFTVSPGTTVTIALNSSGDAVAVVGAQAAGQVVMYLANGTAYINGNNTPALFADNQGTVTTYTYDSTKVDPTKLTKNTLYVFTLSGTEVTDQPSAMQPNDTKGDTLYVVSASESSLTIAAVKDTGAVDTGYNEAGFVNGYMTFNGTAVYAKSNKSYLGIKGASVGDTVSVYSGKDANDAVYYALVDNSQ